MDLTICYVNSAELATIAQQLPAGRIHANGRGLVPNVRRDPYDKLIEATRPATNTGSRYNKLLIAGEGLQKVQHAAGEARTFHYAMTQPWMDDGA
jgi:hypothetical protein